MKHGVNWKKQHVWPGEVVAVYPIKFHDKTGREPFVGKVQKVKKNRYGRISYVINDREVWAEELWPAHGERKLKIPMQSFKHRER